MASNAATADRPAKDANTEARRRAMAVIARARADELAPTIAVVAQARAARDLKPVETGLVMLRGRIGGDGAPFNLGEATVTRAIIELDTGERGFAHILGRDHKRARLAALADALWQREETRGAIETAILEPVAARLATETAKTRAETAATRVDFFTLVRGEDAA
jgi:alpha-D-ribose 1-methylphosphonate 5-triphosphate synthase subunit PhnG